MMYFRPTLAMEALVESLELPRPGLPAFALFTAAGDPGAALHLMMERLERKGFHFLEAHWVICPSNYPIQLRPLLAMESTPLFNLVHGASKQIMRPVWRRWPQLRPFMGLVYKEAMVPEELDRNWLDEFLDLMLVRYREAEAGRPVPRPRLERHTHLPMVWSGRATPAEKVAAHISLSCDPALCTACGLCTHACPVGCITPDPGGIPQFGPGCTGCYACFNACDHNTLSAIYTPHGAGRYTGPPREMRALFAPKRA